MLAQFLRRVRSNSSDIFHILAGSDSAKGSSFYRLRGLVIGGWASVEALIDTANHYGWAASNHTVSNVVPQNFRWKIQLFKKLHVELPLYRPLKAEAHAISACLDGYVEDRHFLVHGYTVHDKEPGWLLQKYQFEKDGSITAVSRRFTEDELYNLANGLTDLMNQTSRYIEALVAEIDKHSADNSGS